VSAISGEIPRNHRFLGFRAGWTPRSPLGPRRRGSLPAAGSDAAPPLQGIRGQPEWILHRLGHWTRAETRLEKRVAAPRHFERGHQNLGCGACATDEQPRRSLRSRCQVESEFLPRRGGCRTAILFRLAAYANARTQLPRSGSVWRINFCAIRCTAKITDLPSCESGSKLASLPHFPYAFFVKRRTLHFRHLAAEHFLRGFFLFWLAMYFCDSPVLHAGSQQKAAEAAIAVTKVEPPNWWVGLTPEVMLLLSGHDLEATHVACNLPALRVSRTQATAGGDYLFVWLKIGAGTKSGTAVCRITAPKGTPSFELP